MIPNPKIFPDWSSWANQIQTILNPFMERVENGSFFRQGRIPEIQSFVVGSLPNPKKPGRLIFVSNESGGAVLAFSDGTNFRRVTDRAIVS